MDIRLGNTFSIVEDSSTGVINLENKINYKTITSDTYILLPNQFVLAATMGYFDLPEGVHLAECVYLFKTPDGLTRDSKAR